MPWPTADGQRIVGVGRGPDPGSGIETDGIKIWDVSTHRLVHSLMMTNILGIEPSPSGRWAIVSERDRKRIWDVAGGVPVAGGLDFEGSGGPSAFSRDESKVATVKFDGTEVRVLGVPSGRSLTPPLLHSNGVISLAFDPQGRWLVTGTSVDQGPLKRTGESGTGMGRHHGKTCDRLDR